MSGYRNVGCRPVFDVRFSSTDTHGLFENIREFHKQLRGGFHVYPDKCLEVSRMIALQDGHQWVVKFIHEDLSSLNVLARGDNIIGLDAVLSIGRPQLFKTEVQWFKQGLDCARSIRHHRDTGSPESTAPC